MNIFSNNVPEKVYIVLDEYGFALYDQLQPPNQNAIARDQSSKKLSKWAFANGAVVVRHDYDLKLEV